MGLRATIKNLNKEFDEIYLEVILMIIKSMGSLDFRLFSKGYKLCNQQVINGNLIKSRKWYSINVKFEKKTIKHNRKEKLDKIEKLN